MLMGKTIVGIIDDFFAGETVEIAVLCKKEGVAQDITSDTVTLTIKENKSDADAAAVLQDDADVVTYGVTGTAYWNLTPAQTDIDSGTYYVDIVWYDGAKEHVVYDGTITIMERVSDV